MKTNQFRLLGLTFIVLAELSSVGLATPQQTSRDSQTQSPIVEAVREATQRYLNVEDAMADGYEQNQGCVSGPELGAMGVHFAKSGLFDGEIDVRTPEVLVYEPRNGGLRLVAVEYVAPALAWQMAHPGDQPHVMGHLFHYVPGPNRYGPDSFYELHVWAWRDNPNGLFADWNPRVSCAGFETEGGTSTHQH